MYFENDANCFVCLEVFPAIVSVREKFVKVLSAAI